ncbi:TPA: hypothetical protein ACH3X3_003791 [Trebouxia sp. C0006]
MCRLRMTCSLSHASYTHVHYVGKLALSLQSNDKPNTRQRPEAHARDGRVITRAVGRFLIFKLSHLHGIWRCHQQIQCFTQRTLLCIAHSA